MKIGERCGVAEIVQWSFTHQAFLKIGIRAASGAGL